MMHCGESVKCDPLCYPFTVSCFEFNMFNEATGAVCIFLNRMCGVGMAEVSTKSGAIKAKQFGIAKQAGSPGWTQDELTTPGSD